MELPLQGIRVVDFTWLMAGPWGTRQLAALGAEVIRIEWEANLDSQRLRDKLPLPDYDRERDGESINRSGRFNNTNTGKLGLSLNVKNPEGKEILRKLLAVSDVVIENFTAGVLPSWGFGFEEMERIKPDIIYVQLPGYGSHGPYSDYRAYGLINQAFSGLSYAAGVPEPDQPCGWGYGYMDTMIGDFNSVAIMSALHYRNITGEGQYIDMAQTEVGICITGPAYLEKQANGRGYQRSGNRSARLPAAPHGVYRCVGENNWVAIVCFDEDEWHRLCSTIGDPAWTKEERFATIERRIENQPALDGLIEDWTKLHAKHVVMHRLQKAGVRAGAVQNAQEIIEYDYALVSRDYLTWVPQQESGAWPVESPAGIMAETPSYAGGARGRGAPSYGEDTDYVLGDILGYSPDEIAGFRQRGSI